VECLTKYLRNFGVSVKTQLPLSVGMSKEGLQSV